jgi:hypothetical protein
MTISTEKGELSTETGLPAETRDASGKGPTVFLDLDTVMLAVHRGRRGYELGIQPDLIDGIDRLSEITDHIVALAYPRESEPGRRLSEETRIAALRAGLGASADGLLIVGCDHHGDPCDCAKPGSGLIDEATQKYELPKRGGWFIGADQEGVVSARVAGLHTIRIGPLGADHLSSVHRPDYEARDLLDAANHILLAELA